MNKLIAALEKFERNGKEETPGTPHKLVSEMLDKLPSETWTNPSATFLDPSCSTGTFLLEIFSRLFEGLQWAIPDSQARADHILTKQLWGCEPYKVPFLMTEASFRRGLNNKELYDKLNLFNVNLLDNPKELKNMKFDVVVMNPPYQIKVGPKKTEPIWQKFVLLMMDEYLKDGGYISSIHPPGWRAPTGRFSKVKEKYLENQFLSLAMNGYKKGKETFGVGTAYDVTLLKKNPTHSVQATSISTEEGGNIVVDLSKMPFIPDGKFNEFLDLLPVDENVEVLYSRSAYGSDKDNTSFDKTAEYIHPCVYTIGKSGEPRFMYSSRNDKGHFGIPKVIWSNGGATVPLVDAEGKYGMAQFSYAIADEPENLPKIKKALENEKFLELMSKVSFSSHKYNYKVISCLKKDWWRKFQ